MRRIRTRLVPVALACAAVLALAPGVARATPGPPAIPPLPLPSPLQPARPRTLGVTPAGTNVEFDVVLRYRERALDQFVQRVNDPSSPDFHHYATPEELGQRFGISDAGLARVRDWLERSGFSVVESFPQRTSIRVAGPARAVDAVLGVTLVDKFDPSLRRTYHQPKGTPRVPAAVADVVEGVSGLDTRPVMRPGVAPQQSAKPCAQNPACLPPSKLDRAFDITPLHDRGFLGDGQSVAVIMDGPVSDDDLRQFDETSGLTGVPPIERITVGSGPDDSESSQPLARDEATMDVETVQGVAPHTQVLYYYASLGAFADAVNKVVSDGRAKIITFSAGGCDDGSSSHADDDRALRAANAAGVNVFVSSGDHGAYTCLAFNPNDFRVVASEPADSPYVISVGATFLEYAEDGSYVDEAAWVEPLDNWATGGGLSPSAARPSWQRGPGVDNSSSNGKRQVPDVSAPGDPESGWLIVVNGDEQRSGGTSASSPFWAGITSLFGQMAQQQGLRGLGFLAPTLYSLAASSSESSLFHDVVRGDNLLQPATPGWDYATGLGSPHVAALGDAIVAYLKSNGASTQ
ncbi:MAG TPA: S53 family peptidase [Acidimicrobiia bacterium]|nr:S53 family peptidase [Acidimicrobiia bacterium]